MAKREEQLGFGGVGTTGVVVSGSEATAGGEVEVVVVGAGAEARQGEPLLPL